MMSGKPAYRDKHPCTGCQTGYLDCVQGWTVSMQCCKNCDHPTRWLADKPYTDAEIADMRSRVAAGSHHKSTPHA